MKSETVGERISEIEVTNISEHGFWLLIEEKEYFLPFVDFPWFKNATIAEISDVVFLNNEHLFWGKLDVDLTLYMIKDPSKYPLISK
jgi:hypothetical protein